MFSNYLGGTVGCPCLIVIALFSHLVSGSLQYEVDLYLVSLSLSCIFSPQHTTYNKQWNNSSQNLLIYCKFFAFNGQSLTTLERCIKYVM